MMMTAGEQAIFEEPKQVVIAGRTYEVQPLGLRAMAPLARIMLIAEERGFKLNDLLVCVDGKPALDADGNPQLSLAGMGRFLVAALGYAEAEVMELLSLMLGVPLVELRDPLLFPFSAIGQLLTVLASSVDISAFLSTGPANGSGNETEKSPDTSRSGESST